MLHEDWIPIGVTLGTMERPYVEREINRFLMMRIRTDSCFVVRIQRSELARPT